MITKSLDDLLTRLNYTPEERINMIYGNKANLPLNMGQMVTREEWPEIPSNMGEIVTTTTNPHQLSEE
ncbi:MAG: hypothetical protein GY853_15940 [PVC group bacterium]|nr:hypothetical protein [PVC group bacterium]